MKYSSTQLKKVRKKISSILGTSLLAGLFVILLLEMIYKFADKPFYFYKTRYDVVLTDSMSTRNEKYSDFLEGTEQIQAFDFVVSEKITDDTKLQVYDVVIFDNPNIGIDMHRIVDIDVLGFNFDLDYLVKDTFNGVDVFRYSQVDSVVRLTQNFRYTDFEVVLLSSTPYNNDEFYFNVNGSAVNVDITTQQVTDGYYKNTITHHRDSKSPALFSITKQSYQFNSYFESIRLYRDDKELVITPDLLTEENHQEYIFEPVEKFLIRGDKANTDDGWYSRAQLQSKVIRVIPKFGYFARFISSPYGTILIVGLAAIPVIYSVIFDKKKEENEKK